MSFVVSSSLIYDTSRSAMVETWSREVVRIDNDDLGQWRGTISFSPASRDDASYREFAFRLLQASRGVALGLPASSLIPSVSSSLIATLGVSPFSRVSPRLDWSTGDDGGGSLRIRDLDQDVLDRAVEYTFGDVHSESVAFNGSRAGRLANGSRIFGLSNGNLQVSLPNDLIPVGESYIDVDGALFSGTFSGSDTSTAAFFRPSPVGTYNPFTRSPSVRLEATDFRRQTRTLNFFTFTRTPPPKASALFPDGFILVDGFGLVRVGNLDDIDGDLTPPTWTSSATPTFFPPLTGSGNFKLITPDTNINVFIRGDAELFQALATDQIESFDWFAARTQ